MQYKPHMRRKMPEMSGDGSVKACYTAIQPQSGGRQFTRTHTPTPPLLPTPWALFLHTKCSQRLVMYTNIAYTWVSNNFHWLCTLSFNNVKTSLQTGFPLVSCITRRHMERINCDRIRRFNDKYCNHIIIILL